MNVAPYVLFCVKCHTHILIWAYARRKERKRALPKRPAGPRIHMDETAGASGDASGSTFIPMAPIVGPDNTRLYGGPMASVRQFQVTFDCAEPERVARFWCEVLGYVVPPPPEGFATWDDFDRSLPPEDQGSWFACIDPSGAGPRLFFQRVPEGKSVKNRVHLDVRVGTGLVSDERLATLEAECARLVALGAVRVRLLPADDDNESCIVMQDVEGNEFDLD
jgi:Glyoxalase-like domain